MYGWNPKLDNEERFVYTLEIHFSSLSRGWLMWRGRRMEEAWK